jgi:hypothetical protein
MEIVQSDDLAQGADVLSSIPTITSEEELKNLLGDQKAEAKPAPVQQEEKKPANPNAIGNAVDSDADDSQEGETNQEEAPVEYPTLLHYLDEKFEFGLNLDGVNQLTKEQEAEALEGIIERMTEGVNAKLSEYQQFEAYLQDPEIQEVLRAKQEGKSLKDLYNGFASSPDGMDDNDLAVSDFKKRFPKSPEQAIQSMVDSLKQNGQFEPFVKSLREQLAEEQSLEQQQEAEAAKREEEQQAVRYQEEVQRYQNYLSGINQVYGVPLNREMKEAVFQITTIRDKDGMTALDYALQSDEGTVLAALGVAFMKDMIQNSASIQKNRARSRVMDKIFDNPEKLQSSGGRVTADDPYDPSVLNRF